LSSVDKREEWTGRSICKVDDTADDKYFNKDCTGYLNREYFDAFFDENCKERQSCIVKFNDPELFDGDVDVTDLANDREAEGAGTCLSDI